MLSWKKLEAAIALSANIARDYLASRTSDSTEKKQLENDIEQNPAQYNDTAFSQEVNDGNKEFNNEAFTNLENDIKENPQDFVNHESEAISEEASQLLDDDKRNDEIAEDMYVKMRQEENREWANSLIEKYNQSQYEMPEDLFDDLTEEDIEWASQMIDDLVFGKEAEKTETDFDIEQAQADDAYAMGVEENNYLPPEEFKSVGAFLGGAPADVEDVATDVEYTIRDDDVPVEETVDASDDETQVEEPVEEDEATTSRRNNFLDKLRRSISVNPANGGSFTAESGATENATGGAIGKGIGSNINGQSSGVGVNANLGGNSDAKENELKEYKEQRNIDSELHYDDVPVEQMSSVSNPGANNGNTEEQHNIKVPNAHSSFSVKNTKLDGKTGHAYGPNKVELDEVKDDDNNLEEILKTLDDYSMFEPLVIENINDEILVDGSPLKMASNETLKYIEEKLNG